jgi:hypothetical protein
MLMNGSLIDAFPKGVAADVTRLAEVLDPHVGHPTSEPFSVACEREAIQIPYRIYRPIIPDKVFGILPPNDRLIAACWFTRHHDGHVRERFLRARSCETPSHFRSASAHNESRVDSRDFLSVIS